MSTRRNPPMTHLLMAALSVAAACTQSDRPGNPPGSSDGGACAPLADYRIAFTADRGEGFDVYVVRADGTDEVRLTDWPGTELGPRWSSDGTRIAFNADRDGGFDLWVVEADGSNPRKLTDLPGGEWDPDWSRDDRAILFTYDDGSTRDILAVDVETGAVRNLTGSAWHDYGPVWSPDGSRIAFLSNRHGADGMNNEVYVMSAEGGAVRRVTTNRTRESILAWYPDGMHLAWTQHPWGAGPDDATAGSDEIHAGGVDGGTPRNLTNDPGADEHVAISADGCWMVFDSDRRGGPPELFVSNLDPFHPQLVGSGVAGLWSSIRRRAPAR